MLRLHGGDKADVGHGRDVGVREALHVLDGVRPLPGHAIAPLCLAKDVDGGADSLIANGMDARRDAPLGRREHIVAHERRVDGRSPAVTLEARVHVGLVQPCGVSARHAIKELLGPRGTQEVSRESNLQRLDPFEIAHVLREQVDAHGQLARREELFVQVFVHVVHTRQRAERHVTDARDALGETGLEVPPIGTRDLIARQTGTHPGSIRHARSLSKHPRRSAALVSVEAAAGRGLAVLGDAQLLKAARVDPERMEVPRVQGDGTIRKRPVKRRSRRRQGRVP